MQLALKHLISPSLSPEVLLTIPAGQSILLENVTWQVFAALLVELGNSRAARIAYSKGVLEILAPLPEHKYYKEAIADLIKDLAELLKGVPELWRYEQRQIKVYQLQKNNVYVETTGSLAFPCFPIAQIIPFIQSNRALETRNMRSLFRTLVKQNYPPEVNKFKTY